MTRFGLHAGLTLQRKLSGYQVPVVIRMAEESGLARLLMDPKNLPGASEASDASTVAPNLFAFGYLEQTCTPELLNNTPRDNLARAAHEEFVQQRLKSGDAPPNNPALQPWESLEQRYRETSYRWVDQVSEVLMGLDIALSR